MSRAISEDAFPSTVTAQPLLPINRWLVWKEARQLLPLMFALILAAAALLLIQSEMFTSPARVAHARRGVNHRVRDTLRESSTTFL